MMDASLDLARNLEQELFMVIKSDAQQDLYNCWLLM